MVWAGWSTARMVIPLCSWRARAPCCRRRSRPERAGSFTSAPWRSRAAGAAFNVNGEERLTWWQYLNDLSRAIGLPPLNGGSSFARRVRCAAVAPVRTTARVVLDRFRDPIMAVYQSSPTAQRLMRGVEGVIRRTPAPAEYRPFPRKVFLPVDKARALLGYRSQFPASRGVALSPSWLRHHGFLGLPEGAPRSEERRVGKECRPRWRAKQEAESAGTGGRSSRT